MKTRKEIEDTAVLHIDAGQLSEIRTLQLEVLLDIRDILNEQVTMLHDLSNQTEILCKRLAGDYNS